MFLIFSRMQNSSFQLNSFKGLFLGYLLAVEQTYVNSHLVLALGTDSSPFTSNYVQEA